MVKTPLGYQRSEYDCGPTSVLNAVSFLFDREQIPPEIIRSIMIYALDAFGEDGTHGHSGTSRTAMMFLSHWLCSYGQTGRLPIQSRYLAGSEVTAGPSSDLWACLRQGGAVVVRVMYDVWHYVLLTGLSGERLCMFDPYYHPEPFSESGVEMVDDHPAAYNRLVDAALLDRESGELYALGPCGEREAVLLYNGDTRKQEAESIEYYI